MKRQFFRAAAFAAMALMSAAVFTSCGDDEKTGDTDDTGTSQGSTTQTVTAGGVQFTMVKVQGGSFKMGAQSTDPQGANYDADAYYDEAPVHSVTVGDFWIGETEVTQALWEAVMGSNPSYFAGKANNPVETVSWDDCQTFISNLNTLTGKTFRLPTEAEWEYAARGGKQSAGYKYSGSNTAGDVAWYSENNGSSGTPDYDGTKAVKGKQANELGLYDMSGNVYEWCQDYYASYTDTPTDGSAHTTGFSRVIRGGCWNYGVRYCRVSFRINYTPGDRDYSIGLRLSCSSN